jgi:ATP-dependent exoDNAse (exonuclease V) alpha subunit
MVVLKLDAKEELASSRIPMEKFCNGRKFTRWQVPIRLMYASTVHSSEGMTLARAVIDLRTNFWKHGQLYAALSRVTDPVKLCFLLPGSSDLRPDIDPTEISIHVRVDVNIAHTISRP